MRRLVLVLGCLAAFSGCGATRSARVAGECSDCLPPKPVGLFGYRRVMDNWVTSGTARQCARRDLKQIDDDCDAITKDFRKGYTQAYVDLAMGRPACVPAVPPPKYWHAWYRSCGGRDAVDQWFAGYRQGLDLGTNSGVSQFNRVVPNLDGGCVSAAYINPYTQPTTPELVRPLSGQTLSQQQSESEKR